MTFNSHRGHGSPSVRVLLNVREFRTNPYPRMWVEMLEDAGAEVDGLSRRTLRASSAGPSTMVHVQWPEVTIDSPRRSVRIRKTISLLRLLVRARVRRNRILVTLHNARPHEAHVTSRLFWFLFQHMVTDVHVLDAAGWPELRAAMPALRRAARHEIPHVNYRREHGAVSSECVLPSAAADVRSELLYFGSVRPYKGLEQLLTAVSSAPADRQWSLTLCGRPQDASIVESVERAATGDPRIQSEMTELPDDVLYRRVRRADLIVLPYRHVLNSGSLVLALSIGVPVLVPDTPTFRAIAARVGAGWVTTFSTTIQWADIERALAAPRATLDMSWCDHDELVPRVAALLRPARGR